MLSSLLDIVKKMQQQAINRVKKKYPEYKDSLEENLQSKGYKPGDLDNFSVSDRGITFIYNYSFPEVSGALEPEGKFFLSYTQLKPYINPQSLLGPFISP